MAKEADENPTLAVLRQGLSDPRMQKFVKSIKPDAIPMGGIGEFDLDDYKASMKLCKNYTCVVPVTAIDPFATSLETLIPSISQVQKCVDAYWCAKAPRADFEGTLVAVFCVGPSGSYGKS